MMLMQQSKTYWRKIQIFKKNSENLKESKKPNEIEQLSLQQSNIIDQLNDENQELICIRIENERLQNDLIIEKKSLKEL